MANKKTKFNRDWLTVSDFSWLAEVKTDQNAARCTVCQATFSLSNMGRRAVTSHMESKKHVKLVESVSSSMALGAFFPVQGTSRDSTVAGVTAPASEPQLQGTELSASIDDLQRNEGLSALPPVPAERRVAPSPRGLDAFLLKEDVTRAEIIWTLEAVLAHKSMRSSSKDVSLFNLMFPDSKIAQKMELQRDKQGYLILYGLSPFFKEELLRSLSDCNEVTIGFDESLNKVSEKQQMDINVRFWDAEKGEVVTRYLTSVFLGHTTAHDLTGFLGAVQPLLNKLIHVSMDGPNVNFKFLRELRSHMQDQGVSHVLLDMGSCGLHTLHCAFKAGVTSTGWDIVQFLRALYNLFKRSPARRADYTAYSSSTKFPYKFCSVRWLENQDAAQRAIDILPHVRTYVKEVLKGKNPPTSSSFKAVQKSIEDPLLGPKLAFFKTVAADLEPFLREFQTDAPMSPFVEGALTSTLRNIMVRFVQADVLDKLPLTKIDITKAKNLLNPKDLVTGHATRSAIRQCKENTSLKVSDLSILQFRKDCQTCLEKIVLKILERSPLKIPLTKAISCFDPKVVAENTVAQRRLESLLSTLVDNHLIDGTCADRTSMEFRDLCKEPLFLEQCKDFSRAHQRLDHFWGGLCRNEEKTRNLWKVLKMIMILSHGNSNVERGFSINRECIVENLKEESLVARRTVYNAVSAAGGVSKCVISKSMIHAARNARARSKEAAELRQKAALEKETETARKKKAQSELKELKEKKARLLQDAHKEAEMLDDQIKDLSTLL